MIAPGALRQLSVSHTPAVAAVTVSFLSSGDDGDVGTGKRF